MARPQGIVWADNRATRSLADKVRAGAASYKRRFGHDPDTCWLRLPAEGDGTGEVDGIRLVWVTDIPPHHFWFASIGEVEGNGHGPTEPAPEPEPEPEPEPIPPPEPSAPTGTRVVRWGCSARCGDWTAWGLDMGWCPSCGARLERIEL